MNLFGKVIGMSLYDGLKDEIVKKIIQGEYPIGGVLATEQELCEQTGLSRVTVRKALDELKREGLLEGVPRQGTLVRARKGGFSGNMDLIALVAAVHDPFFALFMEHFEQTADKNGSLMLFKQDYEGKALRSDKLFFRFIQKGIRNAVIWPQTDDIDFGLLMRLQTVGMNFVIFDQQFDTDVADIVCLDHYHAVYSLYEDMRSRFDGTIVFIGFEGLTLSSEVLREKAFMDASGGSGTILTIGWNTNVEAETALLLESLHLKADEPLGIICISGGIGLAVARHMQQRGLQHFPLATVDYLTEMSDYPMTAYEQPMIEMAEKVYQRLAAQNNEGRNWRAGRYLLRGRLVKCGFERNM
ncbi:GntR family transcriptional regulator [Paenibacillus spongiae]|uniref:GntR family transcriptional regulator n=1 Tax=Paenibacillus spongiae TaxID=2909671 RepID=A0ABY5SK66_9BACL|nr:GntR family transcriptional regulator [Paenibacillus spongiae]UVI33070.1 GntR family transcriptional regulator [Paenibacillus spongiae]